MANPIKFTEEELSQLKELQNMNDQLIIAFGQINMQKHVLETNETQLKAKLEEMKQKETSTALELSKKYGKGTLDIESGEFTPSEE
jgi:hypothetical protein|tara:strand:+ start:3941 stop:4198 length:258 start_codon:yes stop_codon:yes gene_type:complete